MRSRSVTWLALLLAGCSATLVPVPPFPAYAIVVAGPDCPPAGRMATTLVLRPAAAVEFDALGPQLRVSVWRDDTELSGRTFASSDRPLTGGGFECAERDSCTPITDWRVEFEERQPDGTLIGVLTIPGPEGALRRGRFRAVWQDRQVFCI